MGGEIKLSAENGPLTISNKNITINAWTIQDQTPGHGIVNIDQNSGEVSGTWATDVVTGSGQFAAQPLGGVYAVKGVVVDGANINYSANGNQPIIDVGEYSNVVFTGLTIVNSKNDLGDGAGGFDGAALIVEQSSLVDIRNCSIRKLNYYSGH